MTTIEDIKKLLQVQEREIIRDIIQGRVVYEDIKERVYTDDVLQGVNIEPFGVLWEDTRDLQFDMIERLRVLAVSIDYEYNQSIKEIAP